MSEGNVAALHEVYEQWAVGNWRPRFAVYADDFEWGYLAIGLAALALCGAAAGMRRRGRKSERQVLAAR